MKDDWFYAECPVCGEIILEQEGVKMGRRVGGKLHTYCGEACRERDEQNGLLHSRVITIDEWKGMQK